MGRTAADLADEANRLERIAKGLDKWSRLAFAAAPIAPPTLPELPGAETWAVIPGGLADTADLEPATSHASMNTGAPDAA